MQEQDLKQEVLDVRKVIEKSTSKVSLRDLEKKGFRQVKVLRAGDINQLIMKAVQNVLAKTPRGGMSEQERQRILQEARADFDRQMAEHKKIQQAHQNLQAKLQEVNAQLAAEKQKLEAEKQAFQRDKQALMEKSLEGQRVAAQNYEAQIADLRERLSKAEGGVSREEYEAVRKRYAVQLEDLENDVERYRKQIRQLEEDNAALSRAKGQVRALEEENERLRRELEEARANAGKGGGGIDPNTQAEMQRMRMEFEQNQARMQEMLAGIANSLVEARRAGAGTAEAPDLSKQFAKLQQNISDAVRKATAGKGGEGMDLTAEQASALFSTMLEEAGTLETNMADVKVKEQKAASVSGKLAKLRNLRKQ
ncbi:MAG: hypothetical protein D6731_11220 [Planctomycetota bacterium]|nr:MAG: hypothetical protein D6731_11220 [Planctomycetota bacterium]